LVPWTLFSSVLGTASGSVVGGASLISKVYFPRIVVPLASAASFLLDFAIGLALLAVMLIYYAVTPSIAILLLPFFSAMAFLCAFAMGVWLSALNVRYRDIRYVVPFLLQMLLFISPLGYPVTEINGFARILYAINPVTGIAEGFRWVVLDLPPPPWVYLIVPTLGTLVLLVTGVLYFRKSERSFADLI
jgi:lipopolysaccharide transport system permease protein